MQSNISYMQQQTLMQYAECLRWRESATFRSSNAHNKANW